MHDPTTLADAVRRGLTAAAKSLPPSLFYDERGSRLFDRITELPEYYLTRAERSIFEGAGNAIVAEAARHAASPLTVLELGAGNASKTQVLLRALVRRQGSTRFVPADVSPAPLEEARARLAREEPQLDVRPHLGTHAEALAAARAWDGARLVLFIGSSIGNYEDEDAIELLTEIRRALGAEGSLLLGTDLRKSPELLLPAYDDAQGVTSEFNKNVLRRINRELGGRFDLECFRHVALWNDAASCIEMHLESTRAQRVRIDALDLEVSFAARERIHTESSHKYDEGRVERLLAAAGLARSAEFKDERSLFAVHLAHAR
ncbi:MAG: L-histidine N(alpha)-methyltransferase [Myxococcales bacterium]|nr:L-histidine N(alpha)-methyltransferase [Myxococcales bacterium]